MSRSTALTAVLTVAALAAGCGSSSSSPSSSTLGQTGGGPSSAPPTSTQPPASTTQPPSSSSTGSGKTGPIPTKTTKTPAATAMGKTIIITPTGFSPAVLIAPLGPAITWENESGTVQSVHLDNFGSPVDSGPIQPGHAWSFNPHSASSIIYHSTYHPSFRAQLQVQAVGDS